MIRLFRWLIWGDGHKHNWVVIRKGDRTLLDERSMKPLPNGYYYDLQCDVCGNIKVKNT